MKLEDATNIYIGTTSASAVYLGTDKVWPKGSNATSTMTMLDVPTFRTLNNISTTSLWSEYNGTYDIGNNGLLTVTPPSTEILVGGVSHDHIYITDDNGSTPYFFAFNSDAILKFKNRTYTKIVFKDSNNTNTSPNFIVSSGTFYYDANTGEYVWTGNSNEFTIDLNNVMTFNFKYLYFE